ncbi:MAG: DUF6364 family protein [Balneolales bacterium]
MKNPKYKRFTSESGSIGSGGGKEKTAINIFIRSEKEHVKSARMFAKKNNISLSTLVDNYFKMIHEKAQNPALEMPASSSLKGVLKEMRRSRFDYFRYLEKKYR